MKEEEEIVDQMKNMNIEEQKQQNIQPHNVYIETKQVHKGPITGIARHDTNENLFSTISEDNTMRLWDYRIGSSVKLFQLKSKEQVANCLLDSNFIWGACDNKVQKYSNIQADRFFNLIQEKKKFLTYPQITQVKLPIRKQTKSLWIKRRNQSVLVSIRNNTHIKIQSGDNYIFEKDSLAVQCSLKGQHNNACFSNDFIYDSNDQQLCFTSGFDYKLTGWNYIGVQNGLVVKQTDLCKYSFLIFQKEKLHAVYSPESVSPPIIYSIYCNKNQMLVSVETGHIYGFSVEELTRSKNIKKKPPKPDFCIDGHIGKVMRSIYCHFNTTQFVSISSDRTMGIWRISKQPKLIQKIQLQEKPNWIETFKNNLLLVSDISEKLSIFILQ